MVGRTGPIAFHIDVIIVAGTFNWIIILVKIITVIVLRTVALHDRGVRRVERGESEGATPGQFSSGTVGVGGVSLGGALPHT